MLFHNYHFNWIAFELSFYLYGTCILFGLYLFLLLILLGFSWFLDGCFGTMLRMRETWENMEAVGAVEDRAWVEVIEYQNLWIKKGEKKSKKGMTALRTFLSLYSLWYLWEGWEFFVFLSFILEAFEDYYCYWDCTSKFTHSYLSS